MKWWERGVLALGIAATTTHIVRLLGQMKTGEPVVFDYTTAKEAQVELALLVVATLGLVRMATRP